MTSPNDPETQTRNRGESPQGATEPVPAEPNDPLTHARGETPWAGVTRAGLARPLLTMTEPREPVTKSRGEGPTTVSGRLAVARTEPREPEPINTSVRGESPQGRAVIAVAPRLGQGPKRTTARGESPGPLWGVAATVPTPLEPKTSIRGEDPKGLTGSLPDGGRPRPTPSPAPTPGRTWVRGEASSSVTDSAGFALATAPMTVLGVLAARQDGRG